MLRWTIAPCGKTTGVINKRIHIMAQSMVHSSLETCGSNCQVSITDLKRFGMSELKSSDIKVQSYPHNIITNKCQLVEHTSCFVHYFESCFGGWYQTVAQTFILKTVPESVRCFANSFSSFSKLMLLNMMTDADWLVQYSGFTVD